jgi:hypothetical protein
MFAVILFCSFARLEMNAKNAGSEFPNVKCFAVAIKFQAFLKSTSNGEDSIFTYTDWTGAKIKVKILLFRIL